MMQATAGRSPARLSPKAITGFDSGMEHDGGSGPFASLSRVPAAPLIRRKCAACSQEDDSAMSVSPKLEVGAIDDPAEREADAIADRVMAGDAPASAASSSTPSAAPVARAKPAGGTMPVGGAAASAVGALGGGKPMPASDRAFFEPRLGQDLSHVRLHDGPDAEAAASGLGARAFTIGSDIVFGRGEYGSDHTARHLLAHELAHVQQNDGVVRMAQLDIVDAGMAGPLLPDHRRAAVSCPISCSGTDIGTFHAMPIFYSASRGSPLANSSGANGVGAALHFIRNGTTIPSGSRCSGCKSWEVIQVIRSNEPADPRGNQSFVDNRNTSGNPYYTQIYSGGHGLHTIGPASMFPDGGSQVDTAVSLYDIPYRTEAHLASIRGTNFFWEGEACVTCRHGGTVGSPSPDQILGCVKYGFTRPWLSASNSYGDAVATGPTCGASPTQHFIDTLHSDPTTSGSYWFRT